MIVPMKHLTLLCVAKEGEKALEALRDLGCVHVDFSGAASAAFAEAKGALADAERAVRVLAKAAKEASAEAADARFEAVRNADLVKAVLKAEAERDEYRRNLQRIALASGLDYGTISETTGLPKDIVIPTYCRSSKREHAPQSARFIQLILPLREIIHELRIENNA